MADWIALQRVRQDSAESAELMWAAEELTLFSITYPTKTWQVILDVISATDDEWILTNLGSGLVETLLATFPDEAFSLVEGEYSHNARLQRVIENIWKNLIPDDVWLRLKKL